MKILFKQSQKIQGSCLESYGIQSLYFKKIFFNKDDSAIMKKAHHHNGFEIHLVIDGYQEYEVGGRRYRIESGDFLIIYPNVRHSFLSSSPNTLKYAFTFNKTIEKRADCFFGKIPERVIKNLEFASNEASAKKEISATLIENCILEILVSLFRISGTKENEDSETQDENAIVALAKQYVEDNSEGGVGVSEVAEYCHLSTKQFTRIFSAFEGVTPGSYIIKKRIEKIESLLVGTTLSLKQISDRMNFSSEYYFNSFFTKYSGMPPAKYRKMQGK